MIEEHKPMVTLQITIEQAEAIVAARSGPGDTEKMEAVRDVVGAALNTTIMFAIREAGELEDRAKAMRSEIAGRADKIE